MTSFKKIIAFFLLTIIISGCINRGRREGDYYFGSYSEAEIFYNRKEYQKAIQRYQSYIDENPEGNLAVISQYYIAKSHLALGRTDEAKALFSKILSEHPDMVWANFSEGQLKEIEKGAVSPDAKK